MTKEHEKKESMRKEYWLKEWKWIESGWKVRWFSVCLVQAKVNRKW
jgi:hypothetical protein